MKVTIIKDVEISSKELMDELINRSLYFSNEYNVVEGVVYHYERTGWNEYDNVIVNDEEVISNVLSEYGELKTIELFLNKTKKYSEPRMENFRGGGVINCKDIYIHSGTFVIVKDSSGNIIAQFSSNRNRCRKQFEIELVNIHNVPMNQLGNIQVYINGKRIR